MTASADRLRVAARIAAAILAAFFLQTVLLLFGGVLGAGPDLILSTVAAVALVHGPTAAISSGAVAGLLQDSFSTGILGMRGFSKPLVGYGVARIGERLFGAPTGQAAVVILGAGIADQVVVWLLAEVTGVRGAGGTRFGAAALGLPVTVGYGLAVLRVLRRRRSELVLPGQGTAAFPGGLRGRLDRDRSGAGGGAAP